MKPLTTEDFVRRIVGTTLRSGAWRGRALCVLCLERLAVEELGRTQGDRRSQGAGRHPRETRRPGLPAHIRLCEMREDAAGSQCVSEVPPVSPMSSGS